MYGHEKSDFAIVATKLPNNAGNPAAEAVERRARAKGNTGQQSTCRTQNRESVSQALERVRNAARRRRHVPEAGAGCLNWARPDLCGGGGVSRFPTAIKNLLAFFNKSHWATLTEMKGWAGSAISLRSAFS